MNVIGDKGLNEIIGEPASAERCNIRFLGKNAKLIIDGNCRLDNSNFKLRDNATIIIRQNVIYTGSILAEANCHVELGESLQANGYLNISCAERAKIILGRNCLISAATVRSSDMHPIYDIDTGDRINLGGDVIIGDHVWLAQDCMILKGVTVGSGSVVAAMTVVTRDVPSNSIVAGNPGKVIRNNIRWDHRLPPTPLGDR